MENKVTFCIAEHLLDIINNSQQDYIALLPSLKPFSVKEYNDGCIVFGDGTTFDKNAERLFTLTIDDSLLPLSKEQRNRIDIFNTGNGDIIVDSTNDGGYQFIIKDIHGMACCMLQTDKDFDEAKCALNGNDTMRHFGLNTALMMMYAFRGSFKQTLLIHASLVRNNGYGYAFTAKSGTGKSTHTSLWIKHIEGSDLMNDDNPIIRIINGKCYIYGSPWSGKTPCYRNIKAPLGAITKIERDSRNWVERMNPVNAFSQILPACSTMKWDKAVYGNTCDTVARLIETAPSANILHCRPDEEAARVCFENIAVKQ